ncbi:diadenylate cyclase CdaA [Pontiella sulfatireligans]|uniref:Diadenylate cyclase n=1 Tax=Pontiella sulfatireligans TaxID=2750658 RepID=A0A6C2UTC9_9BACT|nr:diadenylate cyclase CdaA [Pontiella sulfatireligans]VGO22156.1 Cyclic di-AMP synthase CdaA [Pontiella sulfatireligans]
MQWKEAFELPDVLGWIEIFIVAALLYFIFRLFKGTRGAAILTGLIILSGTLYAITSLSHLDVLNWLLSKLMLYISLAVVVIFQPEIRRVLAKLGRQPWSTNGITKQKSLVEPIMQTVKTLSTRKIGALIAIEREIGTRAIQDTGTKINSVVSAELLSTIFFPHTPLHDGGVIISGDRICAAGCLFPLSQKEELSKTLGTRHRAAIGLTEETDSIVVVISEETGAVSIAYNGRLRRGMEEERLRRVLTSMLRRERTGLARFQQKIQTGEATLSDTVLMPYGEEHDE